MGDGHGATGMRQQRLMLVGLLVGLLMTSAVPGYAQRGRHGGHGFHSGPRGGGHGSPHGGHGFVRPRVVVPVWPYWNPYWDLYVPPPRIVAPPPRVYVEPTPYTWYYCANPPGYYPFVQQCPGGWQPVAPPP
jgi:hypothetical protein